MPGTITPAVHGCVLVLGSGGATFFLYPAPEVSLKIKHFIRPSDHNNEREQIPKSLSQIGVLSLTFPRLRYRLPFPELWAVLRMNVMSQVHGKMSVPSSSSLVTFSLNQISWIVLRKLNPTCNSIHAGLLPHSG